MKELRDQSAHFAAAIIILLPLALLSGPIAGAFAGFGIGMVREITEEGEVSHAALMSALGSWKDLLFWTLGGVLVGVIS